jgi:hypothetical protein
MAVRFSYMVQQPDGAVVTQHSEAERPPTWGQLAGYVSAQGGTLLPATPAAQAPQAAPPAAPPPAPAPARPSIAQEARQVILPEQSPGRPRSFGSQVPSVIGSTVGGTVGGYVGGPFAPVMAGVGGAVGEAGQIGAERVMGWPPAEPGTFGERLVRAGERGATGELLTLPIRYGLPLLVRSARPTLEAAEALKPVLTGAVPAESTLVHAPQGLQGAVRALPIDEVVANPAVLRGVGVTPEMQQTVLTRWWQTAAEGGPEQVVKAWDTLGETGQQALAGTQRADMATIVNTLRGAGGKPLIERTPMELARTGVLPGLLTAAGHPWLGTALGLGTEAAKAAAPGFLLRPGPAGFLGGLPQTARSAAPWVRSGLRAASQAGVAEFLPQPGA